MTKTPDEIELDSIEDISDPRALELVDYFVMGGTVYHLQVNDYAGKQHLKRVDEIPERYWERWDDE